MNLGLRKKKQITRKMFASKLELKMFLLPVSCEFVGKHAEQQTVQQMHNMLTYQGFVWQVMRN